jgi:hypothetical protein
MGEGRVRVKSKSPLTLILSHEGRGNLFLVPYLCGSVLSFHLIVLARIYARCHAELVSASLSDPEIQGDKNRP